VVPRLEAGGVQGSRGAGGEEPPAGVREVRQVGLIGRIELQEHLVPVVQARPLEVAVGDGEAERLDENQPAAGDGAQPGHVAGVGGNLGGDEDEVEGSRQRLKHGVERGSCD